MADYNLKDDLLGFGRSQLKYLLFHNTTLAGLTAYTHKKGLFFYDTGLDSVEILKNNGTRWTSAVTMISSNDPIGYVTNNDIEDRLVIGSKLYAEVTGFNPGVAGFVTIDINGNPLSQAKITFEDILSSDYTTVITAPGVDTRFATEKAIVDYVTSVLVTPQDNILDWDGTKYLPFSAKKGVDPTYPYLYTGASIPSYSNTLNLDGILRAKSFNAFTSSTSTGEFRADALSINADATHGLTVVSYTNRTKFSTVSRESLMFGNTNFMEVRDLTDTMFVSLTTITLNKGTALKYLYLDASKNITYVDAPAGGVTPVDNILDWDTNAYKPYTAKTASAFYTGVTVPDAVATILNYDGIFRATQLFEGNTRVMTTHGNWAANGSLHAVTTTAHAGFCPQLPATATGTFLRDDGTWGSILWKRTGTTLSQFTSNDLIDVTSNVATGVVALFKSTSGAVGVKGESSTSSGVFGSSSSGTAVVAQSSTGGAYTGTTASGIGINISSISNLAASFLISPTSTNTFVEIMRLDRRTSGTADVGLGGYLTFYSEIIAASSVESGRFGSLWTSITALAESASFEWWLRSAGTVTKRMELTHAGQLIVPNATLTGLSTYADNIAALAGGLTAGQLYKTSTGVLMITY